LAVQPLLPALLLRRPVLLKSARSEPLFAPAFVRTLVGHCPELGEVVAAVTWRGGDRSLEERAFGPARQLLAYGRTATLEALGDRGPALLDYGPKISLAAVDASVEPREVAPGLARDVALFEQRSCLSIHAVYTAGDPRLLADALAGALRRLAETWPPGPLDPVVAAQLQQLRSEARMRGLHLPDLELREGTVVVDPLPAFRPSPGGRCVRVHPLADLAELPHRLELWRGRLQGMALAGAGADALRGALEDLGVSRTAPPGRLQAADASWQNGGRDLLEVLSGG
jgi:hypothetical protein